MSIRFNGSARVAACALLVGLLATPAIAQAPDATISMSVDSITETDVGFVVTGTVTTAGPTSEAYVNRYYTVTVLAEIMDGDAAQYPKLPKGVLMTTPDGASTGMVPGSGPGGTLTSDELSGVEIASVTLGRSGGPGTFEFSGTIPATHAGKPCRIRAMLDFQVMYSGAMYPGITYKHAEGYSGAVAAMGASPATDPATPDDTKDKPKDDVDPPFDVSGDFDLDTPEGKTMDDLIGHGGDFYTKPVTGVGDGELFAFTPPSTVEGLKELIDSCNAQLGRDDLTHEQRADITENRNDLAPLYHQALLDKAAAEQLEIWANAHKTVNKVAVDKLLTYNIYTGPVWSTGKAIVAAIYQKWFDMALDASTVPPSIPLGGGKWMGNPSQLIQDYITIANAFMPTYTGHRPDTVGGTYGNWGTPGLPYSSGPTSGGHDR